MSAEHWFGCDLFGRDILSRVMYGTRFSLAMGVRLVLLLSFLFLAEWSMTHEWPLGIQVNSLSK